MQRANGDWFAFDDEGRLRVPLFHSVHDAMMARLRNLGLLLFKPVVLDTLFLKEIAPLRGEDEADFCMVDDPFVSLNRGRPMTRSQLASLMGSAGPHQSIVWKANTSGVTLLNASSN